MVATEEKLVKVVAKSPSQRAASLKLGMSQNAINERLKDNPHLKEKILDLRKQALEKSGLSLVKAFERVDQALDAKIGKKADHDIRLKAAKMTAEFYHVVKDDGQGTPAVVNILPVVILQGKPLEIDIGNRRK